MNNPWLLASRPKTLTAAIAPVMIGTALALRDGFLHVPSALAAWAGLADGGDEGLGTCPQNRYVPESESAPNPIRESHNKLKDLLNDSKK